MPFKMAKNSNFEENYYLSNLLFANSLSTCWLYVYSSTTAPLILPTLTSSNIFGVIQGSRTNQPPRLTPLILSLH